MKIMLLLLSTLGPLASTAFAQGPPPPSYYTASNVQGVFGPYSFYTFGPQFQVTAPSITCDCTSTTFEWDGKRWNKVIDLFSIPDLSQFATTYIIGANGTCAVANRVTQQAYTKVIQPFGTLFDQGIGTRWEVNWAYQGVPYDRHDQWEMYCDGAGPEEINQELDPGPCGP